MALQCAPFLELPGNISVQESQEAVEYCQQIMTMFVPCTYLWLLAPVQIYHTRRANGLHIPWTGINVMKIAFGFLLVVTGCVNWMIKFILIPQENDWSPVALAEPIVASITVFLAIFLSELARRSGHKSSLVVFVFWFLLSITSIIRHVIKIQTIYLETIFISRDILIQFICSSIYMPLVLGELILSAVNDTSLSDGQGLKNDKIPTEEKIMSRLFFEWNVKYNLDNEPILHSNDSVRYISRRLQWLYSIQRKRSLGLSLNVRGIFCSLFCMNQWRYRRMKHELTQSPFYEPSLWSTWFQLFSGEIFLGCFVLFCSDVLLWSGPILLGFLMNAFESKIGGIICVLLMFFLGLLQTILRSQAVFILTNTNLKIHNLFLLTVYKKALSINSSRSAISLSQVTEHADRINGSLVHLAGLVSLPVQIAIELFVLSELLGYASFIIAIILVLINIILSIANNKIETTKEFWSSSQSSRNTRLISKGLLSVQMLKCYGWDGTFYHQVRACHANDMICLQRLLMWKSIAANIVIAIPILMHVVIFLVLGIVLSVEAPEPDRFYVSLAILLVFRHHNHKVYAYIWAAIEMAQSFKWIDSFLNTPDLDQVTSTADSNDNFSIRIQNGRFTWSPDYPPALKYVNLELLPSQLAVVIGSPRSGKSSLLNCILGEMIKLRGKLATKGRITYVSQNPWLRCGTIRDNILFGHPPNDFYYDEVIKACHLIPVFEKLEKKDLTSVQSKLIKFDRSIQQQICLARAVFTNADIYLLDNFMQDLDPSIAINIYTDVIGPNGLLRNKTRVLVVSSFSSFIKADVKIQVFNGKVVSSQFTHLSEDHESSNEEDFFSLEPESYQQTDYGKGAKHQTFKPLSLNGESPSVLMSCCYFCVKNTTCLGTLFSFLLFVAVHGVSLSFQIFISSSIDASESFTMKSFKYIFGFGVLIFFVLIIVSGIDQKKFFSGAADKWHERTIATLLRLPRFTFGELLRKYPSRQLAADLFTVTEMFAAAVHRLVNIGAIAIVLLFLISISITPFWILLPLIIFLFVGILKFYCKIHRRIVHRCTQTRQPIFDYFDETITGLEIIRAFQRQHEFVTELENFLDASHVAHTLFLIGARWLVIRTDLLARLVLLMTGIIGVVSSATSSSIGLAVVSGFALSHTLREFILSACDIQKNCGAISRLHEIMQLPLESSWRTLHRPGVRWPEIGAISFRAFVCCRPKSLQLLLRGITCDIKPGEKVGIIGKPDEIAAIGHVLLRLLDGMTGSIYIDGIDISQLGLYDLRSRLTIITKDVMYLMPGTLWRNLDPQKEHLVEDVQVTVRISRLQSFVSSLPRGLMHELDNDDPILTDEIRLQLCLARALLRKPKILIVDLDIVKNFPRVYQLMRAALRCAFSQSTVLSLTTSQELVEDCDRIMILENGSIKSFDVPVSVVSS